MCEEHIKNLFTLQKVSKGSADQLRLLVDTVTARFNALCSLNTFEEISNALVVHLALASLDNESQQKLEEAIDYTKSVSWDQCAAVLNKRCQVLEARSTTTVSDSRQKSDKKPHAVLFTANNSRCHFCKIPDHQIWNCNKFKDLLPLQRYEAAEKAQLCTNCLSSHHSLNQCKASACKKCKGKHHSLLHDDKKQSNLQQQQFTGQINSSFVPTATATNHFTPAAAETGRYCHVSRDEPNQVDTHTILATVLVNIYDKYGNKQVARALLDSASQLNVMTRGFSQKLNVDKIKTTTIVGGIGESHCKSSYSTNAILGSRHSDYSTSLDFLILPTITGQQPSCNISIDDWNIPKDLELADPQFNIPHKVDLLIGADIFFDLFYGNQIQLGNNKPTLLHTKFGWIVSSKYSSRDHVQCALITVPVEPDLNFKLVELVQQFWEMEKVPNSKQKLSKKQTDCELHFQKHVKRLTSGRFMVKLPLKIEPDLLGDSQNMAVRRFLSLKKRLNSDVQLKGAYTEFLKDYESDGRMQRIPWPKSLKGRYFLAHHCVLRPQKSTTKCRVVFDASAKTTNNLSLNDIMMVGPVVQCELFEILLRFRLHRFGLMADIAAMYRQILVYPEDQQLQNIIWRNNS